MAATLSPCIGVCRIDARSSLCEGCYRTLDEITGWAEMLPEQRRQVLLVMERRQAGMPASHSPD